MSHLLLEKAFRYKIPAETDDSPANHHYDTIKGYWINSQTGDPLVADGAATPPRTKKEDIETGEDRKSE